MKVLIKESKELFKPWTILGIVFVLFTINFTYFYLLSESIYFSLIISLISAVFLFLAVIVRKTKTKRHKRIMEEVLQYTASMTFHLKSGKNVIDALKHSKTLVNKSLQKEIQTTIDGLNKDSKLDTENFKKFNFIALDKFHRNLKINYEEGGNVEDTFNPVNDDILFEITNTDDLYRKKNTQATEISIITATVLAIPLTLKIFSPMVWEVFLSITWPSHIVLVFMQLFTLIHINSLTRKLNDISIKV